MPRKSSLVRGLLAAIACKLSVANTDFPKHCLPVTMAEVNGQQIAKKT